MYYSVCLLYSYSSPPQVNKTHRLINVVVRTFVTSNSSTHDSHQTPSYHLESSWGWSWSHLGGDLEGHLWDLFSVIFGISWRSSLGSLEGHLGISESSWGYILGDLEGHLGILKVIFERRTRAEQWRERRHSTGRPASIITYTIHYVWFTIYYSILCVQIYVLQYTITILYTRYHSLYTVVYYNLMYNMGRPGAPFSRLGAPESCGTTPGSAGPLCIYIYIYTERERCMYIYIYIYIHTHTYIYAYTYMIIHTT